MNIHGLSVSGFKSFGKKVDFLFDKPITAVVGPNGSGKSNVTEAIRFVLGEQSAKNMRIKDATDLLFRGADARANVLTVTVTFKKNEREFTGNYPEFVQNLLEQGEINITRQVYADGKNLYKINNIEVRLKDIQELMMHLSINTRGSWHISQGASDKILLASPEDRKTLIEDSLGLRIYQSKIEESQRKLEKSKVNMQDVSLQRRELAPDLQVLSKQIEKIQKLSVYKTEIKEIWSIYHSFLMQEIERKKDGIGGIGEADFEIQKQERVKNIHLLEKKIYENGGEDTSFLESKRRDEEKLKTAITQKVFDSQRSINELTQKNLYLKAEKESLEADLFRIVNDLNSAGENKNQIIFKEKSVHDFVDFAESEKINIGKGESALQAFTSLLSHIYNFVSLGQHVSQDNLHEIQFLTAQKSRITDKLQKIVGEQENIARSIEVAQPELQNLQTQLNIVNENISSYDKAIIEFKLSKVEIEKEIEVNKSKIIELEAKINSRVREENELAILEKELEDKAFEIRKCIGTGFEPQILDVTGHDKHEIEKKLERLIYKIEDSQISNSEDVEKQYSDLVERDNFLEREISDLTQSIGGLEELIFDLREKLKMDFTNGIAHINSSFDSYVQKLFGGGYGKLHVVQLGKDVKEDNQPEVQTDETRLGVEVEIDLPKKKVKGLHSLSGGERALVSIALTVAILSENYAPFLVLDEADATLDEANAKRYGELLDLIKQKSKLIVVTHNRETMAFADQVYGVTLEKGGASKVLSVSFEDALEYSK